MKAWEERYLPKSHLGLFFLVFGDGKETKENIAIFWFIWPLNHVYYDYFILLRHQAMLAPDYDEIVLGDKCENTDPSTFKQHLKFNFIPSKTRK